MHTFFLTKNNYSYLILSLLVYLYVIYFNNCITVMSPTMAIDKK